jgi:hypothetical protein
LRKENFKEDSIKELTKNSLIKKNENNNTTVDNNNFMITILTFSGLDLSELIEDIYFPDENFPDLSLIQEVISNSTTSVMKIKNKDLSEIINLIFTEVYNQ